MSRLAFLLGLVLSPGLASAETIRLSKLKDADFVAIQRGYSLAEGACALDLINQIDAYGGPAALREFSISFEDEPLRIFSKAAGIVHTCDDGVHRMTEEGRTQILQRYNDKGEPTMEEP